MMPTQPQNEIVPHGWARAAGVETARSGIAPARSAYAVYVSGGYVRTNGRLTNPYNANETAAPRLSASPTSEPGLPRLSARNSTTPASPTTRPIQVWRGG